MEDKTILVIEDDPLNMELVKAVLSIDNYHVIEASDAHAGIELCRRHKPDLVLMDIQLPDMDGLTATRIIKEDELLKDVAVVALSAYAMEEDVQEAFNAGCSGYITKPFKIVDFLEQIKKYIESR